MRAARARRSGDGVKRQRDLEREVEELRGTTVGHLYGTVPHLTADPTNLRNGSVWIRSDLGKLCFRANGATVRVP